MNFKAYVPIMTILLLVSCGKQDFSTLTATDENGNIQGEPDYGDWDFDSEWEEDIVDMMNHECGTQQYGKECEIVMYPAFPNPAKSSFRLVFTASSECFLRLAIVNDNDDAKFNLCTELVEGKNALEFNTLDANLESGNYYRMYYAFSDSLKNVFYKGHGDILIK